jgi:hypothetical protein
MIVQVMAKALEVCATALYHGGEQVSDNTQADR